ncbi:hypothetical protein [uncultured Akkermansia sp.]|uniref:hypothetical protein n=1 Tax=uncultured Akkermansia sp. TaxID=512294 RepID=UPI002617B16C|nr:hypothetical protein [uncultured Akkermansia sp.]
MGGSLYSSHQQKKQQRAATVAAQEAAKRNVSVGVSAADPSQITADAGENEEVNRQNASRRRYGMARTVNPGGVLVSLTGGRKTLGG